MQDGLHFIAGLPRSGSTLLAALLRQNPRFHAGMSSPVHFLFSTLMRGMSQANEGSVFIDDDARTRVLRGCVDNYYSDVRPDRLVFDTNRGWCAKMPVIARLWPKATVIACVRNPAWVLDSIERLVARNPLEPSGIFSFSTDGTVYSRTEGLMAGTGLIGYANNALREAVFGPSRGQLLLVRYETLATDPQKVLSAIYARIGAPEFAHDPEHIEPDYEAMMFDARMGTPGLHTVAPRVQYTPRVTTLPLDLFNQYATGGYWDTDGGLPQDVAIV